MLEIAKGYCFVTLWHSHTGYTSYHRKGFLYGTATQGTHQVKCATKAKITGLGTKFAKVDKTRTTSIVDRRLALHCF